MTAPARQQRRPLMQTSSRQALRDFQPRAGSVDAKILAYLEFMKGYGATDSEIEQATGLSHQSISGCRRHLVERGLVHASEKRRPTASGRAAIVWLLGKGPSVPPFVVPNPIVDQIEMPGIRQVAGVRP